MSEDPTKLPAPTARLRFRPYLRDDAAEVEAMFADTQARRFYPDMGPRGAQRWIEWNLRNYVEHGVGLWAVEELDTGVFVGDCGLTYQVADGERVLEVGYHLTASRRGEGYAIEAATACRDFALDDFGAVQVFSIVDPRNDPSIAVARRIHQTVDGFTNENGERMLLFSTVSPAG